MVDPSIVAKEGAYYEYSLNRNKTTVETRKVTLTADPETGEINEKIELSFQTTIKA